MNYAADSAQSLGWQVTCWVHLPQSLDCGDILLDDVTGCGTCKHTQYFHRLAWLQLSERHTKGGKQRQTPLASFGHDTSIILT